jgi:thiamine-phosphate pyrophosphorylase
LISANGGRLVLPPFLLFARDLLLFNFPPMKPLAECRLYTFVDTAYLQGRAPEVIAQQLCDGGSDLIQLRAKHSSAEEIRRLAEKIQPVIRRANVGLVINDHLDIACEIGADICHLGQEDFFDAGHTHINQLATKGKRPLIGLSTHAPEQAQRALAAGADYIAIGPIYATGTKPTAKPVTLEYVRWAATHATVPWFAIGGINQQTLPAVLAAGADRICVVSAILNAPDVAKACAEFRRQLPA